MNDIVNLLICAIMQRCMLHARVGSRSEMDITPAFEAVIPGSNPGGSTRELRLRNSWCYRATELLQLRQDSKGFSLSSLQDRKPPAAVAENPGGSTKQ